MKLIAHQEAFEQTLKFLQPELKRHAFGVIAPEGVGRQVFTRALFEHVTGQSSAGSDFRFQEALGVEDIRLVQDWASRPPVQGKVKFLVIIPCDRLSLEAQSALLKILEEPPPYLVVFLVGAVDSLLHTIASRLVLIRLKHLIRSSCDAIWSSLGIDPSMYTVLWGLAQGQPGIALKRLTHNYPALFSGWGKFMTSKPTSFGLLHWQDQLPKEWTADEHRQFWLWAMPHTFKAYKDPTSQASKFALAVSAAITQNPEITPRLLVPAIWHEYFET